MWQGGVLKNEKIAGRFLISRYYKGGTGIRTQDNGFANRGLSPLGDAAYKFF